MTTSPNQADAGKPGEDASDIVESDDGAVRTLTLNRPKALNSFTTPMLEQLRGALDRAAADANVRCVVLRAAGRAFCAGQDLSDPGVAPDLSPGAKPKDLGAHIEARYTPMVRALRNLPVPTVAVVQGVAAGAGANLALGCDIVVAGASASFVQAFSKIGLVPDTGGTWLLPHLAGRARALGLAMLGDKLGARDAERMGLIWRCVEDAELDAAAAQISRQLASMPTRALVATRRAIDAAMLGSFDAALDSEGALQRRLGNAFDYAEGVRAFMDKRAPVFKDR
jgi:2-(1,2-epoxy-1,2-dihydrophenyl)acetyl-CoA isomerase